MNKIYLYLILLFIILLAGGFVAWKYANPGKAQTTSGKTYEQYLSELGSVKSTNTLPPIELSAWIGYWDEKSALETMFANPSKIKAIMPFWYKVRENGEITEMVEATGKHEIEELALKNKIDLMPTIINEFDPDSVSKFLDDERLQTRSIDKLVFIAASRRYKGWDLDLEELYVGDKEGFNDFVKNFAESLHEKNLLLSVTVQAKTGTSIDALSSNAQDWTILSKHADQIRVMAYDYHNADSEAGAVTPLDMYQKTLAISVQQIPLEKLVIALPAYGYDWIGDKGKDLQYQEAVDLLTTKKIAWNRDPISGALHANYKEDGKKHEVWFDDGESARIKIKIAQSMGINKFSFWRIGGEDAKIWDIR